jgi:hypothetical protein
MKNLAKEVDEKNGEVDYIGIQIRKFKSGMCVIDSVRQEDTTDDDMMDLLVRAEAWLERGNETEE